MDDYLFKLHVEKSRDVFEETQYLEIYTYSVGRLTSLTAVVSRVDQSESG